MLISSGTVNLISNNFLINNVSGSVNISSNKEIYFYEKDQELSTTKKIQSIIDR